jgi:hypothetical protein
MTAMCFSIPQNIIGTTSLLARIIENFTSTTCFAATLTTGDWLIVAAV